MRKIAIITGASSGLGKAMAAELAREYLVVNVSRRDADGVGYNIKCDLAAPDGPAAAAGEIATRFGRIDLLVNNAGIGAYGTFGELSGDELRKVMELDFFVPVELTKLLLPLLETSGGTIVNIASMAAKIHVPAMGAYCAAKSAFAAWSETLRVELMRSGVRVLTVYPGRVNTGFSGRAVKHREVPDTPGNTNVKPEAFARKVMKSLRHPRRKRCFFPWWYRPGVWVMRLFEGFYNRKNIQLWKL
ncbi:MAG: SDR family NAD(P)-dependent oxidoreductase [Victivallaceae bacterium]|nr:SDR family NAD(P)-dependent oxidoreductase [Victivallaceae bacterium]